MVSQETLKICVFGAGAWGTAMAIYLDRCGHRVFLIPRRDSHAQSIRQQGENADYLPGIPVPASLTVSPLASDLLGDVDLCVMACPSFALRPWCNTLSRILGQEAGGDHRPMIVSLSKGLEQETLKLPSDILKEEFGGYPTGVLSGPNFAREVAEGKPTAGVLACEEDPEFLTRIQAAISSEIFRIYRSHDVIGVELGGCLKNVYAIGAGICDGLNLGDNAKAALITRSLHEMVGLVGGLGGRPETVYGLSGFGDLVATCFGKLSRNRGLGEQLGGGKGLRELMQNRKTVVEGYWACKCFHDLCLRQGGVSPILEQIYLVLYEGKTPERGLTDLMMRRLKAEGAASRMGEAAPGAGQTLEPGEGEA